MAQKKWMKEADMAKAAAAKDDKKSAAPNPKNMRNKMYGSKE